MTAQIHIRPVGTAKMRVSKIADARDTLAAWGRGQEADIATFGQFSIIDALEAVLERTGPADVTLATWTAAAFDLSQIQHQVMSERIRSLRLIIDRSFVARQPGFVDLIHDRFGKDCVRSTRTHAKFVVVTNADWAVVMRTSMNLNFNPRLEYLQVVDDPSLAAFWLKIADAIFKEEDPGLENRRNVPELASIAGLEPSTPVGMGLPPTMGTRPEMGNREAS
ncbi:MAG: hypothetical protein LH624_01525 [Cryobacterium sp.]|nr:hypothetical protein [Cryobacterium sp.]